MDKKQRQNNVLKKLKEENKDLKGEINTLNILIDNITEHNLLLKDELQREIQEIELAHKKIKESINFAGKIQAALLPNIDILKIFFPKSFVYYKSKDIVSGDFYWFTSLKGKFLLASVDCTGHGVPGAFMSVLGMVLLNDIVKNNEINNAGKILDELRNHIKRSLQQTGKTDELQDSLDIIFCIIDIKTLEMSFAGAFNPLWLIKSSDVRKSNKELSNNNDNIITIYETDEQPVGIYQVEKPFNEHKIFLTKDDIFYIFSDGYISQLSPEKNKSYRADRLNKLLSEIHYLPMDTQKQLLEQNFIEWKGYNNQTDDILIIGIRI